MVDLHPKLIVTQSMSTPDKCSVRPVLSSGAPDFHSSVRDVLTRNFPCGTVVRLMEEEEYQDLMAFAIANGYFEEEPDAASSED
jgi:hypothetical protein